MQPGSLHPGPQYLSSRFRCTCTLNHPSAPPPAYPMPGPPTAGWGAPAGAIRGFQYPFFLEMRLIWGRAVWCITLDHAKIHQYRPQSSCRWLRLQVWVHCGGICQKSGKIQPNSHMEWPVLDNPQISPRRATGDAMKRPLFFSRRRERQCGTTMPGPHHQALEMTAFDSRSRTVVSCSAAPSAFPPRTKTRRPKAQLFRASEWPPPRSKAPAVRP